MDGWATIGFTTARFANKTWPTSTSRRPRATTRPSGGPATLTITTSTCRRDRRGESGTGPGPQKAVLCVERSRNPPTPAFFVGKTTTPSPPRPPTTYAPSSAPPPRVSSPRDGDGQVGAVVELANKLGGGLHGPYHAALSECRTEAELCRTGAKRNRV